MNNANQSEIKQIQISPNFIKVKPKRQTRKKTSAGDLSSGTVNNIKNNLIQRIQSHKLNEMGAIEKIRSDAAIKTNGSPSSCENIYYPPVSNHLSEAMSYLSNINPVVPQIPLNKTLKNTPQPQPQPQQPQSAVYVDPPYGVLKGGSKPLYRDWSNQPQNQTLKRHPTSIGILPQNQSQNAIKIIRKRTTLLGKNKNNVGVLIKNAKTRKDIIRARTDIQNTNIHDIKIELFKKGIIRAGCTAPDDILKNMYESSILSGDITNTANIYQNALDGIEKSK